MNRERLERLLPGYGEPRTLRPKTKLIFPGHTEKQFFFILSGHLQQYYSIKTKKHVFRFIGPNDFCESITLLRGEPNTIETIETVTEVHLLQYDYTRVKEQMETNLELSNVFRKLFEDFLFYQERRIQKFLSLSPKERYLDFVREEHYAFGTFPDSAIASYLGMTKETLSRFRNRKS
ncbi:hypothetical protein LPTSP4_19720 [Leptospira ryugenii]|uniref:Cyclic nucleotide-binding domain-containing protein n=1 Tax=Leptospira ryugenii TaxID=1917863 RepID=A0A2P2E0N5_9LEPT|nr:Crp/Fnr family transcriptional regulator [Leptospira ryugenii]GBF50447.1 hypothetical protein LPTSP4_19720 [Leptospira ryugenii]